MLNEQLTAPIERFKKWEREDCNGSCWAQKASWENEIWTRASTSLIFILFILISNRHQNSQSTRFYTDISHRKQIARKVEAEQELFSNNLFKKLQKSLQEKTELENQLSRSISARNSLSSSMNSSITGLPDSPVTTKERSMSTEVSTPPIKKSSDPAFVSPKRKISVSGASAPRLSTSPHNAYIWRAVSVLHVMM